MNRKFLEFTARSNNYHPRRSYRFNLAQTQKKHKNKSNQRLDQIFIPKHKQKAKKTKNKIGLPPNKRQRLTPLARHDDFNDAHIKDKN